MRKIRIGDIIPILVLAGLVALFGIASNGKFFSPFNMRSLLEQIIPFAVGGAGMIFVIAIGSADLSQGSLISVVAIICALLCRPLGAWSVYIVGALVGAAVGFINGTMVSRFKVSSFLTTLAVMIALRALTQLLLSFKSVMVTAEVMRLDRFAVKIPVVVIAVAVCWYVFEGTRFGFFCKCIGENERTVGSTGRNVRLVKTAAFSISGLMAGLAGAVNVAHLGGANASLGNMFEMRVMMALFIGGIPVSGGTRTKMYKLLIGALIIGVLENGLTLCSVTGAVYEFIEGVTLIAVVALALFLQERAKRSDERRALKQETA